MPPLVPPVPVSNFCTGHHQQTVMNDGKPFLFGFWTVHYLFGKFGPEQFESH